MSNQISDPNPHNLTFPYPLNGPGPARPKGQGCLVRQHQTYCPAVYWFYRYKNNLLGDTQGTLCASWSDNPADKVTAVNQPDLDENEYITVQGIGSEARRNGITEPVTASNRRGAS
jgi:hypothetical protein